MVWGYLDTQTIPSPPPPPPPCPLPSLYYEMVHSVLLMFQHSACPVMRSLQLCCYTREKLSLKNERNYIVLFMDSQFLLLQLKK